MCLEDCSTLTRGWLLADQACERHAKPQRHQSQAENPCARRRTSATAAERAGGLPRRFCASTPTRSSARLRIQRPASCRPRSRSSFPASTRCWPSRDGPGSTCAWPRTAWRSSTRGCDSKTEELAAGQGAPAAANPSQWMTRALPGPARSTTASLLNVVLAERRGRRRSSETTACRARRLPRPLLHAASRTRTGSVLDCDEAFPQMFGYTAEEVDRQADPSNSVHPDDQRARDRGMDRDGRYAPRSADASASACAPRRQLALGGHHAAQLPQRRASEPHVLSELHRRLRRDGRAGGAAGARGAPAPA